MRKIIIVISYIMWIGAGILLFFFWFGAMKSWLGLIGSILAIVITPGLVIFPIIYWIVEGVFPVLYFILWGIGVVGFFIGAILRGND